VNFKRENWLDSKVGTSYLKKAWSIKYFRSLIFHILLQHLKQGDILAIGLYKQKPSSIDKTRDLIDAVVVMTTKHKNCNTTIKAKITIKGTYSQFLNMKIFLLQTNTSPLYHIHH